MQSRLDWNNVAPEATKLMRYLSDYINRCGLERSLLELVKIRASQINGCSYCLDMHTKEARAKGESEQRLHLLAAWRDVPLFTERERAALQWTEEITRVGQQGISDELYEFTKRFFKEKELVDLTLAVILINGYNRLNIAFRTIAGTYRVTDPAI
jgi:AhpD family alkylhydroperoxidase